MLRVNIFLSLNLLLVQVDVVCMEQSADLIYADIKDAIRFAPVENLATAIKKAATNGGVNKLGNNGYAPLHSAIQSGRLDVVMALLARGADPYLLDAVGDRNAVDFAIACSNKDNPESARIVQVLSKMIQVRGIAVASPVDSSSVGVGAGAYVGTGEPGSSSAIFYSSSSSSSSSSSV